MEQSGSGINQSFSPPQATADSQHDKTNNMDDPTAQTAEQTLPELIRFMLEHMRGLQLKCPPTFQPEDYVNVWQYLAAAGNYLIDQIEDLRFEGHGQWESGDEASIQQFGRLAVPQGKEFLRRVLRELASLGTKWHLSSTRAGIDTQPFDPNHVPRLLELETPIVGVKMEDSETDDAKKEAVQEDVAEKEILKEAVIEPEVIKTEAVKPPPQDTVLPSIECKSTTLYTLKPSTLLTRHTATNSFKTPTTPRPADYKTPPRGPSFSPITPPQAVAETNNNSNSNSNSNIAQPHPPLQYPDDQRFRNYLSSINFDANMLSMFNFPTPTDVQEEISPRPRLASQAPVPAPASALAAQKYMDSVRLVVENIVALVFLMLPEPER